MMSNLSLTAIKETLPCGEVFFYASARWLYYMFESAGRALGSFSGANRKFCQREKTIHRQLAQTEKTSIFAALIFNNKKQ